MPLSVEHALLSHSTRTQFLQLAPNPAQACMRVTLISGQPVKWVIYDLLGNAIENGSFEGTDSATLSLTGLIPGFYMVGVTLNNGTSHSAKF